MTKWLIREVIRVKKENRLLRKALKELERKEKPYIDKINLLKSENRALKIKVRLTKEWSTLSEENETKYDNIFEETKK